MIELCRREKGRGRKVLVYSIYTGTRDTTAQLRRQLEQCGFKVAVLRASVQAARQEDWVADQIERGIDVLITNPGSSRPASICWSFRPSRTCSPASACHASAGLTALLANRPAPAR